jgi:hypothetical protein
MTKKRRKAETSAKVTASDSKANENEPKTNTAPEVEPAADSSGTWSHLYREGREALDRIRACRDYEDWVKVAFAVDAARSEAMKIADTNKSVGSRYYKAFGEVLKREGLHTDKLDSAVRNLLFKIVKHHVAIEEWRRKLDPERRSEMNFPRVVLNNWGKTPEGRAALEKPKRPPRRDNKGKTDAQLLNEQVEQNEQLKARLEEVEQERDQHKREAAAEFTDLAKAFTALVSLGRTLALSDLPKDVRPSDLRELAERIRQLAADVETARAEETVRVH